MLRSSLPFSYAQLKNIQIAKEIQLKSYLFPIISCPTSTVLNFYFAMSVKNSFCLQMYF
jgi:hypothetical protein